MLLFWSRGFILISWMNESVPLFQMIRVSVCPWNISQPHCDIMNQICCVFCESKRRLCTYETHLPMMLSLERGKTGLQGALTNVSSSRDMRLVVRSFLCVLSHCLMYLVWVCHRSGG